ARARSALTATEPGICLARQAQTDACSAAEVAQLRPAPRLQWGYGTRLECRLPSPSAAPPRPASRERTPPPPTRRGPPRRPVHVSASAGLDATNWQAELAIRFGVILRKVWGGSSAGCETDTSRCTRPAQRSREMIRAADRPADQYAASGEHSC